MPKYNFAEVEQMLPVSLNGAKEIIERELTRAFSTTQLDVNAFLMAGHQDAYNADEKVFKIFINHGFPTTEPIQALEGVSLNGIPLASQVYLPASNTATSKVLSSDAGVPLVEIRPELHQACILFDITAEEQTKFEKLFAEIMTFIHNTYVRPLTTMFSWKHSETKEVLHVQVAEIMKKEQETQIKELERSIANNENAIKDYIKNLGNLHRQNIVNGNKLEGLKNGSLSVENSFANDLDLVVSMDKVEDLHIKNGIFTVYTKELIMHHDKEDRQFLLGKCKIEIDPKRSNVKFFNLTNPRKSIWTNEDNHPHVKKSGEACIGTHGAIIAELCAQMQFYPLVTQLIDFLENFNTDDSAGRQYVNWDECDKNGKIIKKAKKASN